MCVQRALLRWMSKSVTREDPGRFWGSNGAWSSRCRFDGVLYVFDCGYVGYFVVKFKNSVKRYREKCIVLRKMLFWRIQINFHIVLYKG